MKIIFCKSPDERKEPTTRGQWAECSKDYNLKKRYTKVFWDYLKGLVIHLNKDLFKFMMVEELPVWCLQNMYILSGLTKHTSYLEQQTELQC